MREASTLVANAYVLTSLFVAGLVGVAVSLQPEAPEAAAIREEVPMQCCAYYPDDGAMRFGRIQTASRYGGFGRFGGWAHDYPDADFHMSTILREMTFIRTR